MTDISQLTHHQKLITWAKKTLLACGYDVKDPVETVVNTPWSSVMKLTTTQGLVYLKQTPSSLFIEAAIIRTLRDECQVRAIPEIIAANQELHCFLMKDCGDLSLRTWFNGQLQIEPLIKSIEIYKSIQKASLAHIDEFISLGVPDWRLIKFPTLYQQLVNDEVLVTIHELNKEQVKKLQAWSPAITRLYQELAKFNIPESLNHSDYHDNNMLIQLNNQEITVIDLGETAIDHPFFSLAAGLKNVSERYQLGVDSQEYKTIHDACFAGWLALDEDLHQVLILIEKLLPIYLIFAHLRLMNATCSRALSALPRMNNRVKKAFEWFIDRIERSQC